MTIYIMQLKTSTVVQ